MEKLKEKVRFSIKKKFLLLVVSIILFISASLVLFFYVESKDGLRKEIEKRGVSEVKSLALDIEYAVLTKNNYSMDNILRGRLVKPDIVYVSITGENEETLSKQGRSGYDLLFKANEPIVELEKNIYRSSLYSASKSGVRIYEFATPILAEKIVSENFENDLDAIMMGNSRSEIQYLSSRIGTAKVAISLESMDEQMANLFFISILIVLVVAALSILIAIYFTNMIVKPIRIVALTAIDISEGDFEKRVDVNTSDETGILAANFNKMAISMHHTVNNLKNEISERKRMEKEILEIAEKEKNRIGRDLHDGIGQLLTGIFLQSQVLQKELSKKTLGDESKQAGEIVELTKNTMKQTRDLVRGLSSLHEDENNICEILEELTYSWQKTHGISCAFDCKQNDLKLNYSAITNIYRIVQEALNNAIKHAGAKNITLKIFSENGMTTFQIIDDGIGIRELSYREDGLGLRTMKYRANLIGASLDIRKGANGGTIIDISLKEDSC